RAVAPVRGAALLPSPTLCRSRLVEEGRLDLDAPVARYVPAFGQNGKAAVTVRQLLAHQAGQRAFHPFHQDPALRSPEAIREELRSEEHTSELQSREKLVCRLL